MSCTCGSPVCFSCAKIARLEQENEALRAELAKAKAYTPPAPEPAEPKPAKKKTAKKPKKETPSA
jgi:hypothetical protein